MHIQSNRLASIALAVCTGFFGLGGCNLFTPNEVTGPARALTLGGRDARAYTERSLTQRADSDAALSFGHVAILSLEPTSSAGSEDTGDDDGVDAVRYYVANSTQLTFRIRPDATLLHHIVLRDATGGEVARHTQGNDDTTVNLSAGLHTLELHHVAVGDETADTQVIFVRPVADSGAAKRRATAQASTDIQTVEAGNSCQNCDLSHSNLTKMDFSGLDLAGSNFTTTWLQHSNFTGATAVACNFTWDDIDTADGANNPLGFVNFTNANLSYSTFQGAYSYAVITTPPFKIGPGFQANFAGANLSNANFGMRQYESGILQPTTFMGANFRSANLTNATFGGAILNGCYFEGANLTNTSFQPPNVRSAFGGGQAETQLTGIVIEKNLVELPSAAFGTDPTTGQTTTFNKTSFASNVNLTGADFANLNLNESDFTGAILTNTSFSHANLSNVLGSPASVTGADFSYATITGIASGFFNQNLAGCNVTGLAMTGLQLWNADFSKATVSAANNLDMVTFSNCTFSNGSHGVNLSGMVFPARFDGFSGADLRYANLTNVSLFEGNLNGANLSNAVANGADFSYCDMKGSNLTGLQAGLDAASGKTAASFEFTYMPNSNFSFADLRGARFNNAHIYTSDSSHPMDFHGALLDNASFVSSVVAGADFTSANLVSANFSGAYATVCNFDSATVTGATFTTAYVEGVNFTGAQGLTGLDFTGAVFSMMDGPSVVIYDSTHSIWKPSTTWAFPEQDGTPVPFSYGAVNLGGAETSMTNRWPSGQLGVLTLTLAIPNQSMPYPPVPPCKKLGPCYCNCDTCAGDTSLNKKPCQ